MSLGTSYVLPAIPDLRRQPALRRGGTRMRAARNEEWRARQTGPVAIGVANGRSGIPPASDSCPPGYQGAEAARSSQRARIAFFGGNSHHVLCIELFAAGRVTGQMTEPVLLA